MGETEVEVKKPQNGKENDSVVKKNEVKISRI